MQVFERFTNGKRGTQDRRLFRAGSPGARHLARNCCIVQSEMVASTERRRDSVKPTIDTLAEGGELSRAPKVSK